MELPSLDQLKSHPAFQELNFKQQTEVVSNYFMLTVVPHPEFQALDDETKQKVYENYLQEFAPKRGKISEAVRSIGRAPLIMARGLGGTIQGAGVALENLANRQDPRARDFANYVLSQLPPEMQRDVVDRLPEKFTVTDVRAALMQARAAAARRDRERLRIERPELNIEIVNEPEVVDPQQQRLDRIFQEQVKRNLAAKKRAYINDVLAHFIQITGEDLAASAERALQSNLLMPSEGVKPWTLRWLLQRGGEVAGQLGLAALTGNPYLFAATMAATEGGNAYLNVLEKTGDPQKALKVGVVVTAASAALNAIPAKKFTQYNVPIVRSFEAAPSRLKRLILGGIKGAPVEAFEEGGVSGVEQLQTAKVTGEDIKWDEFFEQVLQEATIGGLAGFGTGGVTYAMRPIDTFEPRVVEDPMPDPDFILRNFQRAVINSKYVGMMRRILELQREGGEVGEMARLQVEQEAFNRAILDMLIPRIGPERQLPGPARAEEGLFFQGPESAPRIPLPGEPDVDELLEMAQLLRQNRAIIYNAQEQAPTPQQIEQFRLNNRRIAEIQSRILQSPAGPDVGKVSSEIFTQEQSQAEGKPVSQEVLTESSDPSIESDYKLAGSEEWRELPPGPERDQALAKRHEAAKRVVAALQVGDIIEDPEGRRLVVVQGGSNTIVVRPFEGGKEVTLWVENFAADFIPDPNTGERSRILRPLFAPSKPPIKSVADTRPDDLVKGTQIETQTFGLLTIIDDSDPSLITVRNEKGTVFKLGRAAFQEIADPPGIGEQTNYPTGGELGIIAPIVSARTERAARQLRQALSILLEDLPARAEGEGGPVASAFAERVRRVISARKTKEGQVSQLVNRILELVSGDVVTGPQPELRSFLARLRYRKAAASLSRVMRAPEKAWGTSRLMAAIEGEVTDLSPEEEVIVNEIRKLIDKLGEMSEQTGLKLIDPHTGQVLPFKRPNRHVAPRVMTAEFVEVLMAGPQDELYQTVVTAFAEANNISRAHVEEVFEEIRNDALFQGPGSPVARTQAEFMRVWPQVPTEIYYAGETFRLFHTTPSSYVRMLTTRRLARLAVVEEFGQDIGYESPITDLKKAYVEEVGDEIKFIEVMRALHALPVEKPRVAPGSELGRLIRAYRYIEGVIKSFNLSQSALVNIPEPLGNIQAFFGTKELLKGVIDNATHGRQIALALEQLGIISRDIINVAFDPGRPAESIARTLREIAGRRLFFFRQVNEYQERLAGWLSMRLVEKFKAGKGTEADYHNLLTLPGIDASLARRLVRGKATEQEYIRLMQLIPPSLVMGNLSPVEQSRIESDRRFATAFAFTTYAQGKIRHTANVFGSVATQAQRIYNSELSPAAKWRAMFHGPVGTLAKFTAANVSQGVVTAFLLAFVTGGIEGLKIKWNEAKYDWMKFLGDSFLYSMIAGPYGAIIRAAGNEGLDDLWKAIYPLFVISEFWHAAAGDGAYRDMTMPDRMIKLANRMLPINKAVSQVASFLGLGSEEAKHMDLALDAYWRWRFEVAPPPNYELRSSTNEAMLAVKKSQSLFRTHMKRGADFLTRGEPLEVVLQELGAALQAPTADLNAVKASLRARKVLSKQAFGISDDATYAILLTDLKNRIGTEAFDYLVTHDALLENLADAL